MNAEKRELLQKTLAGCKKHGELMTRLDPSKVKGWKVIRTWPELEKTYSDMTVDYLIVHQSIDGIVPEKLYDSYVGSRSEYTHKATVFSDFEVAATVAMIMETYWKRSKFFVVPA